MNLYNFTTLIDETILKRGFDYFNHGHLLGITQKEDGFAEALVIGKDDYQVSVQLGEDGTILKASCSCPYQQGPICKHEVAVFYSLLHSFKPTTHPLLSVLNRLTKEELIEEIIKMANQNSDLFQQLMNLEIKENKLEAFEKKLESILEQYIQYDYSLSGKTLIHYVEALEQLLIQIKDEHSVLLQVQMMLLLYEECKGGESLIEDEEDIFFDFMGNLQAEFQTLIFKTLDYHDSIDEVFNLLFNTLTKQTSCDFELLHLIAEYAKIPDYFARIEQYLKQIINEVNSCLQEALYTFWYELLLKYREDEVEDFLINHANIPSLIDYRLDYLIRTTQYEEAVILLQKIEDQAEAIFNHSRKVLCYQLYKKLENKEGMKITAYELFVHGDWNYFEELERLYEGQLPYNKMKKDLLASNPEQYLILIEKQKDLSALLAYVKEHPSFIERYAGVLWDSYKYEVQQLYENYICEEMARANHRSGYRYVCGILKRYHAFVSDEAYEALITQFILSYPRRHALIEQLNELLEELHPTTDKQVPKQLSMDIA